MPASAQTPRLGRVPPGVFWTALALLVLALVFTYDSTAQKNARDHIAAGERLEQAGNLESALDEYRQALENPRLNKKARAGVALRIAEIHETKLPDPAQAAFYYRRARLLNPKAVQDPAVAARMKALGITAAGGRPEGAAHSAAAATSGPAAPVSYEPGALVAAPAEDLSGPVVATYGGHELRAGEVDRTMRNLGTYKAALSQPDPTEFESFVNQQLERAMAYQAGVDAGFQNDPDIAARLYDYQRTLVSDRYVQDVRKRNSVITTAEMDDFYQKNLKRFTEPARVAVSMIRTATEADADKALAEVRAGAVFADVATSRSTDTTTREYGGQVGSISDRDDFIPGVGPAPAVVKELLQLKAGSVTKPVKIGDSFFIFRVNNKREGHVLTKEEARTQIDAAIRARKRQETNRDLGEGLRTKYEVRLNRQGIREFWESARTRAGIGVTTETAPSARATTPTKP